MLFKVAGVLGWGLHCNWPGEGDRYAELEGGTIDRRLMNKYERHFFKAFRYITSTNC